MSTAGCWPSPNGPAPAWSTATGCGTTPRASRTGTRSGPGTASGSCRGRTRCGSTRAAAVSGSEQTPDLTGKHIKLTLSRVRPGASAPVEAFKKHGDDFVVARTLPELVAGGEQPTPQPPPDAPGPD